MMRKNVLFLDIVLLTAFILVSLGVNQSAFGQEKRRQLRALYIGQRNISVSRTGVNPDSSGRYPEAESDQGNANLEIVSAQKKLILQFAKRISPTRNGKGVPNKNQQGMGPKLLTDKALMPPRIDGLLNEPVWRYADVAMNFTQRDPDEGAPATEPTEVRVLYDDENLYIGFRCYDRQPDKIVARQMRNDADLDNDDHVRVILDTYLDRRNGFMFQTNALGARWDAQITDEGKNVNKDWNCVWDVKAKRTRQGWEAELRIPLNQLRYPDAQQMSTWGINFARIIRRKREDTYWSPIRRDYGFGPRGFYRISKAGDLVGLEQMPRRLRLEIKPYSLSGLKQDETVSPIENTGILNFGLDLKYGLTANLIADVTLNTDFAQVEADQERVNLTRFSLFFPEKRDFFLEGAGIFRIGAGSRPGRGGPSEQLFYSRRIGLHNGIEVPIIAGSKITGNFAGLEVGLLDVLSEKYTDAQGDESLPRMNFGVLRLRKPLLERSSVGLMLLSRDPASGNDYNRTFAFDGNFAFGPSTQIDGWLAHTQTPGVSSQDWAGAVNFVYRSDRWTARANYTDIQDNFNAEMGFIRRKNIRRTNAELGRGTRPSWSWLRRIYNGAEIKYLTDEKNVLQTRELGFRTYVQFESGHTLFSSPKMNYEYLDEDWEIHEGIVIPAGIYRYFDYDMFMRTDASRPLSLRFGSNLGEFYNGSRFGGNLNLTYRPSSHFAWDLSYNGNIVNLPAGNFTANVLSTRLTYTLSRNMFAKAFIQWNDSAETLSVNFLYNYYYRPGSNLYLVYNHRLDLAGSAVATTDREVLLKFTYWLNM